MRLWDRTTNTVTALPHVGELATGSLDKVSLSADGSLVAWTINGTCFPNSCFGDVKYSNLFVWDRHTGITT